MTQIVCSLDPERRRMGKVKKERKGKKREIRRDEESKDRMKKSQRRQILSQVE